MNVFRIFEVKVFFLTISLEKLKPIKKLEYLNFSQ
jgi:hypothetical protein